MGICKRHLHIWFGDCPDCMVEKIKNAITEAAITVRKTRELVGNSEGDELKPGRMHTDNESSALIRAMYEARVMNAPTEEQPKDPKWWDENAPKGATHAIFGDFTRWLMLDHGIWRFWEGGWWSRPSAKPAGEILARPTKPPAPEWDGEGLPPVGCEVEMSLGFHCGIQAKITYMGDGVFCYRNLRNGGEYTGAISDATFRPLRTKEQMEMEEIKALALSEVADRVSGHHRVESIKQAIAALCDAGMLRKAGDE